LRPFAAKGLRALGSVPDGGVFQLSLYLDEPLTLDVEVKDTPSRTANALACL
jgi:hypothetical protein